MIAKQSMQKERILEELRALKPILRERFGIESFALFGSVAKAEATQESDIDIAILEMKPKSGFDLIRAKHFIENRLNTKVDIGTFSSMKRFIRNKIENELVYV